MTAADVLLAYQQRLVQLASELAALSSRQLNLAAAALFALALLLYAAPRWSPAAIPFAAGAVQRYSRWQRRRAILTRLQNFYQTGIHRLTHQWAGEGNSGEEFAAPGHLYANDLNLFGPASLFERLSIARTEIGKRHLAQYLQSACPLPETLARQHAVQELTANTALRERLATLGHDHQQAHAATFQSWLARPHQPIPAWLRPLAALAPVFCLQPVLGWALRPRVLPVIESSQLLAVELEIIRHGIALLESETFQSPKLQSLVETLRQSQAERRLRTLARYLRILQERTKEWFYLPSLLLLTGTQTALAIESWRAQNGAAMETWLAAWGEFEALNCLACYAHENPEYVYPTFAATPTFDAKSLAHPLLENPVPNDIRLPNLLIISGSNMAGKSTFLRTIGINTVLAKTGAPVRARSLTLSPFTLVASISIQDALAQGKSRFLAEVERLKAAIDLSKTHPPLLFLIDEIFSGTNSADRLQAAQAVLETLRTNNAIGAVSTHDLALTNLSPHNAHMCARAAADPLDFDYLLKPGINTQSSALAIARLAGVPV